MEHTKKTATSTISQEELKAKLRQFTGDVERYRTMNRYVIYTPGVKCLAENAGAYWLIDAIASYYGTKQMNQAMERDRHIRSLHFWTFRVSNSEGTLSAAEDSGVKPFISQELPFRVFPLAEISIWSGFHDKRWTLYLPSEH